MNTELKKIFLKAYSPCEGFTEVCERHGVCWNPGIGYMPRGFGGGAGSLEDIQLVLVLAEPGRPAQEEDDKEQYFGPTPEKFLEEHNSYVTFEPGQDDQDMGAFHKNLRYILSLCFEDLDFSKTEDFTEAKRRTLITESVLCSIPINKPSTAKHSVYVVDECFKRYLYEQKLLLPNAFWVTVGAKARNNLERHEKDDEKLFDKAISHPSPPEGHKLSARNSWSIMAEDFKKFRSKLSDSI